MSCKSVLRYRYSTPRTRDSKLLRFTTAAAADDDLHSLARVHRNARRLRRAVTVHATVAV